MPERAIRMAGKFLEAATGIICETGGYRCDKVFDDISLRDYLIQILKEKFGLKIKICGNCRHYYIDSNSSNPNYGSCFELVPADGRVHFAGVEFKDHCHCSPSLWIPKEIPKDKK